MKKYFTSKEIDHQWAHELAPEGRCPSHEHFTGAGFYSYGTEIGRILKRGKRKAYLLNVTGYSITTSGHQSALRRAIPEGFPVFELGGIGRGRGLHDVTGAALFDYAIEQAADAAAKLPRARSQWKKDSLAGQQAGWIEQAGKVNGFFGLRRKVDTKAVDRLAARIAADNARQAKAEKARQAQLEKENAEAVRLWQAGEAVRFPYSVDRVCLRALGPFLETSRGVKVPLSDAKRAFKFAQKVRVTGWHRNGDTFKVGEFQLDAINGQGIVAGCHRIDWNEIERFATSEGWTA